MKSSSSAEALAASSPDDHLSLVIKFDSACSRNMSGVEGRIKVDNEIAIKDVRVKGFNNSISGVDSIGLNTDNKLEYYVRSMPRDLALLCAFEYAKEGAAVLMSDGGSVIRLNAREQKALKDFIARFPIIKKLKVRNRTYEIDQSDSVDITEAAMSTDEMAFDSTATRYFNTKVHVSDPDERILATLLTGLSFEDLYSMAQHDNVKGLPRDIKVSSLNRFAM